MCPKTFSCGTSILDHARDIIGTCKCHFGSVYTCRLPRAPIFKTEFTKSKEYVQWLLCFQYYVLDHALTMFEFKLKNFQD